MPPLLAAPKAPVLVAAEIEAVEVVAPPAPTTGATSFAVIFCKIVHKPTHCHFM